MAWGDRPRRCLECNSVFRTSTNILCAKCRNRKRRFCAHCGIVVEAKKGYRKCIRCSFSEVYCDAECLSAHLADEHEVPVDSGSTNNLPYVPGEITHQECGCRIGVAHPTGRCPSAPALRNCMPNDHRC